MRTPRRLVLALLLFVVVLTGLAVALERRARRPAKISAELDVAEALGGGLGGDEADARFTRATLPRKFVFPADHGAHGEHRRALISGGEVGTRDLEVNVGLALCLVAGMQNAPGLRGVGGVQTLLPAGDAVVDVVPATGSAAEQSETLLHGCASGL